jgi:hypothetical protein
MELKWVVLIALEALAWALTLGFVVLRYWFRQERASLVALVAMVVDTFAIAVLGLVDWLRTGELSIFQIVIAGLIVYALTLGREDARRLDRWLGERISRWRDRYDARRLRVQREGRSS